MSTEWTFEVGTINRNSAGGMVSVNWSTGSNQPASSLQWTFTARRISGNKGFTVAEHESSATGSATGGTASGTTDGNYTVTCQLSSGTGGIAHCYFEALRDRTSGSNWEFSNVTLHVTVPDGYSASTGSATGAVTGTVSSVLTISNANLASLRHTAVWIFGSFTGPEIAIAQGVSTASFTVPDAWLAAIPASSVGGGSILLTTINASTSEVVGSAYVPFTVTAASGTGPNYPAVTTAIVNSHETVAAWGIALQGYSGGTLTISPTAAQYGAWVQYFRIQGPGVSTQIPANTDSTVQSGNTVYSLPVFANSGTLTYTITSVDSRGLQSSVSTQVSFSVQPYALPAVSGCNLLRCDSTGNPDSSGEYASASAIVSVSSADSHNAVSSVTVAWAETGSDTYSGETALSLVSGRYTAILGGSLTPYASYSVRVTVTDALGNAYAACYTLGTEGFTFHLMEGGEGAAFGKAAERPGYLEIADSWGIWMAGADLIDLIVPVGSVKVFTDDTDPNLIYPGTVWSRISGRFLYSGGSGDTLGSTGGAKTVALTEANLPAHVHTTTLGITGDTSGSENQYLVGYGPAGTRDVSTSSVGSGTAHQNMPPYVVVAAWKRTA